MVSLGKGFHGRHIEESNSIICYLSSHDKHKILPNAILIGLKLIMLLAM